MRGLFELAAALEEGVVGDGEAVSLVVNAGDELGEVVSHRDLSDEDQSVYVPAVSTTLISDVTSSHEAPSWADSAMTDTVRLRGLVVGETYTVTDTLHLRADDGSDDGALMVNDDEALTASSSFEKSLRRS